MAKWLTPREAEIMDWVSKGKSNTQIGMILHVSPCTVKNHMTKIRDKLGACNKASAVNVWKDKKGGY